jgi:hypothetical protein
MSSKTKAKGSGKKAGGAKKAKGRVPAASKNPDLVPVEAALGGNKARKGAPREAKPAKDRKLSALDAAAQVLKAAGRPMKCRELVDEMKAKGLWSSDAPTPHSTLASAFLREIGKKGGESRFAKAGRGEFALT